MYVNGGIADTVTDELHNIAFFIDAAIYVCHKFKKGYS